MARKPVHLVNVKSADEGYDAVNSNKFYDMFEEDGQCVCYYGRIKDGYSFGLKQGSVKKYPLSQWDAIYREKLNKSDSTKRYIDVTDSVSSTISVTSVGSNDDDVYAPISNSSISEIVERLQVYSKDVVDAQYGVKAMGTTIEAVNKAQDSISQMTYAMVNNDEVSYIQAYKYLMAVIPRTVNRVTNEWFLRRTNQSGKPMSISEIIQTEQDLLDIMRGQIITPVKGQKIQTVKGDKKTILEINGISMEDVNAEDIELIKRKLGSNAHRLKNAWRVTNEKQKSAYDRYLRDEGIRGRDTRLLFHGTRNENVWNILKTGLVLRPSNAVITGKMFGYGIYFAPSAQKSLGYTSMSGSYWAKGTSTSGFMILHEVAYGMPYDVYTFDSKFHNFDYAALRKACPGAHSLHAHAGSMLRNDEIIVYKEEQLAPVFLIELNN